MNSKYLKTLDNGQQRGALTKATVYIRTDSSRSDVRALVHSGPLTADQQYTPNSTHCPLALLALNHHYTRIRQGKGQVITAHMTTDKHVHE